jgi:hypothetical protein
MPLDYRSDPGVFCHPCRALAGGLTWLGLISPLVAVIGDVLSALLVAAAASGWLSWRRLTAHRTAQRLGTSLSDQTKRKIWSLGDAP